MNIKIRKAVEADQTAICELVRSERLNPMALLWQRFIVAVEGSVVVAAVQMRHHADGSRELGSLVVHPVHRGRGLAARLIDALLAEHRSPVQMITSAAHAAHYRRWGFRPIAPHEAPTAVRRNYRLGNLAGWLSWVLRRRRRRLAILERR